MQAWQKLLAFGVVYPAPVWVFFVHVAAEPFRKSQKKSSHFFLEKMETENVPPCVELAVPQQCVFTGTLYPCSGKPVFLIGDEILLLV